MMSDERLAEIHHIVDTVNDFYGSRLARELLAEVERLRAREAALSDPTDAHSLAELRAHPATLEDGGDMVCIDPECYYHEPVMGHCSYCGAALCEGCLCVHEVGGICPAQENGSNDDA